MLRVRLDDYAGDGAAHLDQASGADHYVTGAQLPGKQWPTGEVHFDQVVAILRRRRSLILTIAGIGTVLAVVVGLLIPPKYTANAQLVLEAPALNGAERPNGVPIIDESIDTHVTLLSSRDHLSRVIESLLRDPNFRPGAPNKADPDPTTDATGASESAALEQATDSAAMGTTVLSEITRRLILWLGELRGNENRAVPRLEEFERNTKVIQERRSRVVSVAFTSTNPKKAAAFANRIVQVYIDSLIEQKRAEQAAEMMRLDQQIAEAKFETEKARTAVQNALQKRQSSEQNAPSEDQSGDDQFRELLRHVGNSAQYYDSLLRRRRELRDRQDAVPSGVGSQLFAGVPKRPSSHNPILFIFPAFVIFAIGGSWLAVLLERLDRGLRSREETTEVLGISCIGLVPRLSRENAACPYRCLSTEPFSAYSEAIRSVVAAVGMTSSVHASKVVLLTSSIVGEGKSTLAMSLAAYVGLLGRRVLLVDFAFRQGSRPGKLNDGSASGIVDVSLQNRPPLELIRHVSEAGIDYLPINSCRQDPLALLASEQMQVIVRQLRERYDCVIIDGPAVLGAVEARLLASVADKLLMVVKWGSTRREVAQNAMSLLRDSGCLNGDRIDVARAIVTQVDLKRHARYRYGDIGEFLVDHGKQHSIESPIGTNERQAMAEAHESHLAIRSTFLNAIIPMVEIGPEGLRIAQPSRPKVSGDGTDGCSV
jgi:uncharacterized protein involved in exopolysaccharide biosynthesis/Mrp family chromosome partitioning ATPase